MSINTWTAGEPSTASRAWSSTGPATANIFHFRYDFKSRISWATDVLGRELEVQYNADHRVYASRDYGGERYAQKSLKIS